MLVKRARTPVVPHPVKSSLCWSSAGWMSEIWTSKVSHRARWRCTTRGRCTRWTGRPASPVGWRLWWPPCWPSGCWWGSTPGCSWCPSPGAPWTGQRERWRQVLPSDSYSVTGHAGYEPENTNLPLLWGVVAALLAVCVLLGVEGIDGARQRLGRDRVLSAGLPASQVHSGCTPQLHMKTHSDNIFPKEKVNVMF